MWWCSSTKCDTKAGQMHFWYLPQTFVTLQ